MGCLVIWEGRGWVFGDLGGGRKGRVFDNLGGRKWLFGDLGWVGRWGVR